MVTASLASRSTLRLSEVARHVVIPDGVVDSEWPRIERRIADMAVVFDRWQTNLGELTLGLTADGKYAATVGGVTLSIPRQVGKTFTVGILIVALCIEYPGLLVLWTAHHGRTTTKTFRSVQGIVNRKRVAPHLAPNGIRTANGEQEIRFSNGSILMFGAREHGFGRGMDGVDIVVFDEAQILGEKALEDMVATTNQARHEHGALLFFMGTPPRPGDNGEAFANKRRKALNGSMRNGVYVECSADPDADPDDRRQWAVANPSYPHHTPPEAMERMRENLPSDASWRLEAYGIWPELAKQLSLVPAEVWQMRVAPIPPAQDIPPTALGLDRWHDGTTSIAGAWFRDDLPLHVELLARDIANDTVGVVEWVVENAGRRIPVVIAADSPAAALAADLEAAKVKVKLLSGPDFARACQRGVNATIENDLTHADQPELTEALAAATSLPYGKAGAWVLNRRNPHSDITPWVAATLAKFGADTKRRKTNTGKRRVVVLSS